MVQEEKNKTSKVYSSFRFSPIPKIENSKNSENFLLLQYLTLVATYNAKKTKI